MQPKHISTSKRKRENFMIQIRKNKNNDIFKRNRRRFRNDSPERNFSKQIDFSIIKNSIFEYSDSLKKAIATRDVEEVKTLLFDIRGFTSFQKEVDQIDFSQLFETDLFHLIIEDLNKLNFFDNDEILNEAIW